MGKPRGESRGLKFLSEARPAAMEHLLKFFGESGKHLEPRTRFLISVVTKVINFSPRGIEQYVKRALAEGATPDQVVDAILCSYPCAGLTKVVDAIDVILDMGLPGFEALTAPPGAASSPPGTQPSPPGIPQRDAAPTPAADRWVRVAKGDEVPVGGALHVMAGPYEIALFNVHGRLLAIDHICPHKAGPLSNGSVACDESGSNAIVSCPIHGWKFDLLTGQSVNHPGARVRTYRVRHGEENSVEVLLPP